MSEMTKPNPDHYSCPNCQERHDVDEVDAPEFETPLCPSCRIESLSEMLPVQCPDCGGETFRLHQPDDIAGAEVEVVCIECGRTGYGDDDAVWW